MSRKNTKTRSMRAFTAEGKLLLILCHFYGVAQTAIPEDYAGRCEALLTAAAHFLQPHGKKNRVIGATGNRSISFGISPDVEKREPGQIIVSPGFKNSVHKMGSGGRDLLVSRNATGQHYIVDDRGNIIPPVRGQTIEFINSNALFSVTNTPSHRKHDHVTFFYWGDSNETPPQIFPTLSLSRTSVTTVHDSQVIALSEDGKLRVYNLESKEWEYSGTSSVFKSKDPEEAWYTKNNTRISRTPSLTVVSSHAETVVFSNSDLNNPLTHFQRVKKCFNFAAASGVTVVRHTEERRVEVVSWEGPQSKALIDLPIELLRIYNLRLSESAKTLIIEERVHPSKKTKTFWVYSFASKTWKKTTFKHKFASNALLAPQVFETNDDWVVLLPDHSLDTTVLNFAAFKENESHNHSFSFPYTTNYFVNSDATGMILFMDAPFATSELGVAGHYLELYFDSDSGGDSVRVVPLGDDPVRHRHPIFSTTLAN